MSRVGWYLPVRRTAGAIAGASVGLALFQVIEAMRTTINPLIEGRVWAFVLADLGVPLALVGAFTLYATRRWPRIGSLALVSAATWVGMFGGSLGLVGRVMLETNDFNLLELLLTSLVGSVLGVLFVGPWSIVAGWVTFYLLDRWTLAPRSPRNS